MQENTLLGDPIIGREFRSILDSDCQNLVLNNKLIPMKSSSFLNR